MPDKPHGFIQSPSEMLETAQEKRMNRIYSKTADGAQAISVILNQLAVDLARAPQRADLRNLEQIKNIVVAYVASCAEAGVICSKIGLARALGISRKTLDLFMDKHPEHETAQYLELVCDAFSEALNAAALSGSVAQVYAIFLAKSLYRYEDQVTIKTAPPDPYDDRKSRIAEIIAKYPDEYKDLPD